MVPRLMKRGITAGAVVLGAEAAYAVLRPAPRLPEFDPTGSFGDPTAPPLRVAVLGDSSVTAPGVSRPDEIWISRVCARIGETHHVELRSFAVGGSKASDLVAEQLLPAVAFEPDLAFVAVGANDAIRGVRTTDFAARLEDIVTTLIETGATVVLSGVGDLGTIPRLYPPLRNLMTRRSARFDRVHHHVADRLGAHVIEQRSDHPELWYKERELWASDLFHVSASGHQRWADIAWATIEPLVAARDGSS